MHKAAIIPCSSKQLEYKGKYFWNRVPATNTKRYCQFQAARAVQGGMIARDSAKQCSNPVPATITKRYCQFQAAPAV